jgi:hypothetical protein
LLKFNNNNHSNHRQFNIYDFKDGVYQIFYQLHNDYDAVKYLVDRHITTQEQYNHRLSEITIKQQLGQLEE